MRLTRRGRAACGADRQQLPSHLLVPPRARVGKQALHVLLHFRPLAHQLLQQQRPGRVHTALPLRQLLLLPAAVVVVVVLVVRVVVVVCVDV